MGVRDDLKGWQKRLEARLATLPISRDGAHDVGHSRRVWRNAKAISAELREPADLLVLLAAAFLHDVYSPPKNSARRAQASRRAANKARSILSRLEFPVDRIDAVVHTIEAHSHSANIDPKTLEAKILQDADRLDALGAVGIARLFYEAGKMRTKLLHDTDPAAKNRDPDDQKYALDHYYIKTSHLRDGMNTVPGLARARNRAALFKTFVRALIAEDSEGRMNGASPTKQSLGGRSRRC